MSNFHNIIISISSDIGFHLAKDWLSNGIRVSGTYRTRINHCDELEQLGAKLVDDDGNPITVMTAKELAKLRKSRLA